VSSAGPLTYSKEWYTETSIRMSIKISGLSGITSVNGSAPLYGWLGDTLRVVFSFDGSGLSLRRMGHLQCGSAKGGLDPEAATPLAYSGGAYRDLLLRYEGETYCDIWLTTEGSSDRKAAHRVALQVYPRPVAPYITKNITAPQHVLAAGQNMDVYFGWAHVSPPPVPQPTVEWVLEQPSGNAPTAYFERYGTMEEAVGFTGYRAGKYVLGAVVKGGAGGSSHRVSTAMEIYVQAGPATKLTGRLSPATVGRGGEASLVEVSAQDKYGNVLAQSLPATSSVSGDKITGSTVKFGDKAGPRTITLTHPPQLKLALNAIVQGVPVVTPPAAVSARAGHVYDTKLAVDAYPTDVRYQCQDLAPGVAVAGGKITGTVTKAGSWTGRCVPANNLGAGPAFEVKTTIEAAAASALSAKLSPGAVRPGGRTLVALAAKDKFGNDVPAKYLKIVAIGSSGGGDGTSLAPASVTAGPAEGSRTITVTAIDTRASGNVLTASAVLAVSTASPAGDAGSGDGVAGAASPDAAGLPASVPSDSRLTIEQLIEIAARGLTLLPGGGARAGGEAGKSAGGAGGKVIAIGALGRKAKLRVGTTLSVPGSLVPEGWRATYRWFGDGKRIKGASAATYKVKAKDAGKRLEARVRLAKQDGSAHFDLRLAAGRVPKIKAALSISTALGRGTLALNVKVAAKGVPKPKGTIKVTAAGKKVAVKLKARDKGKAALVVRGLAPGKHRLTVAYSGTKQLKKAKRKGTVFVE
jgi:hypothetical protein